MASETCLELVKETMACCQERLRISPLLYANTIMDPTQTQQPMKNETTNTIIHNFRRMADPPPIKSAQRDRHWHIKKAAFGIRR